MQVEPDLEIRMESQGAIQVLEKVSEKKRYLSYLLQETQKFKDSPKRTEILVNRQSIINDPDVLHALFNDPLSKGDYSLDLFNI